MSWQHLHTENPSLDEVFIHVPNDRVVTSACGIRRTEVVDECNASACSFIVTSDSCPESYLVLGVEPPE